ncbi:MAG: glycoside hydrolase, partial [Bacteroidetes bacterium]
MKFGIANLSIIPVRTEAREQSEMITQILFGETFQITSIRKKWCYIIIDNDNYEGWIDKKLCNQINEDLYLKHKNHSSIILSDMLSAVHKEKSKNPHFICAGSELPFFDKADNSFLLGDKKYFLLNDNNENNSVSIKETAYQFLNSPYLWGGKTNFGIDCSGFTQIVFKINGIKLPRDASQQVEIGETLNFMNE